MVIITELCDSVAGHNYSYHCLVHAWIAPGFPALPERLSLSAKGLQSISPFLLVQSTSSMMLFEGPIETSYIHFVLFGRPLNVCACVVFWPT